LRGEPRKVYESLRTYDDVFMRFPSPERVSEEARNRVARLKATFLAATPETAADVGPYWAKYQRLFSRSGLPSAPPQDLKDFANSSIGANPGNMSVFNREWNDLGPDVAAGKVRDAVDYLLHGTVETYIEDRLTTLITPSERYGMKGFREALLTKVLCIVEPDRFIPIVKYTGTAGKREIAEAVFGLQLPDPDAVSWTIGRLIFWSNDLLRDLVGEGFGSMAHVAAFLWWAKDEPQ